MKMKLFRKSVFLLLAALMLCLPAVSVGCDKEEAPTECEYTVRVKSYTGEPVSNGAVVMFYEGEKQLAMQACGADGVATKKLSAGEYNVKVSFTGGDDAFYYDAGKLTVNKESTEAEVVVYPRVTGETTVLSVPHSTVDETGITVSEMEQRDVYWLNEGCTYVELAQDEMAYFLFMPKRAGIYGLSVVQGENCSFSYYGMPHFIHESPVYQSTDGVTKVTVEEGGVKDDPENTTIWVLGAKAQTAGGYIVKIERLGDPAWKVSQEEWIVYETTATLSQCTVPEGTKLNDFDLTKAYELVYNESDGCYHLDSADGATVYVYLMVDNEYVDCFKTILDNSTVRAYFYDDNGNFIKKEAYGPCLKEYFAYVDEANGVYPLTKDLEYIIKTYGGKQGWWDAESVGFRIEVPGLNAESAWLFMCCYATEE